MVNVEAYCCFSERNLLDQLDGKSPATRSKILLHVSRLEAQKAETVVKAMATRNGVTGKPNNARNGKFPKDYFKFQLVFKGFVQLCFVRYGYASRPGAKQESGQR